MQPNTYQASYQAYQLHFKEPGGTSRGVLLSKMSYFVKVWRTEFPEVKGIGECSILPGLSPDDKPNLTQMLDWCCNNVNEIAGDYHDKLKEWPAIRFAFEMAFRDLEMGGRRIYYDSEFVHGSRSIPINGLIWMGNIGEMSQRIRQKLNDGYNCLKLKIGALNFEEEHALLKGLRKQFEPHTLELRVDANGAFTPETAPAILEKLAKLSIHSIEQPIKAGQWDAMATLCRNTPIPIALDEELISLYDETDRKEMLNCICPQYIILKPSLTGGFGSSESWISLASQVGCEWWVTSALESNLGLNAIAQWTATLYNTMPQGLGTGQVFTNNVESPLYVDKGVLWYKR